MQKTLIVDDEPRIIDSLSNIIQWKEYGFKIVSTANNGVEALDNLKDEKIDLLITDIRMPKMDGLTLIDKAKEISPKLKYIILSAHDEFDYVKKAIAYGVENYILKPINKNELIETLIKVGEKLDKEKKPIYYDLEFNAFKENLLERWVHGAIESFEFEERARYVNLPVDQKCYCVSTIKIFKNNYTDKSYNDNVYYSEIEKIIKNVLSIIKIPSLMFQDKNNNFIILFYNNKFFDLFNLKTLLKMVINRLKVSLNINAFGTVGEIENKYYNVNKSYHNSVALLDYSLFMYKNQIIASDDIQVSNETLSLDYIDFTEFSNHIANLDYKKSIEFIHNIFDNFNIGCETNLGRAKKTIREILLHISIIIRKEVPHFIDIPEELSNLFEKFDSIQGNTNLIEWLKKILKETIIYLNEATNKKSPIINIVIKYIKTNYSDSELSLKTIATKFNVNSSYLGQLFKAETGDLFSNYINEMRIEKAKELSLNSKLKLSVIAKNVGYTNQSYFQKVFKKITGTSPSEFKRIELI